MMSKFDERKILDRLANDKTMEMNADDLEQLLNAELDKPADEMDTLLIQEILETLHPQEPDSERMKADWPRVKKSLPHRRADKRWPRHLMRFGAVAAAISIVMFSSFRNAEAFRWTMLRKLLMPVAETFGIRIDDQSNVTPEATQSPQYSVEDAPSSLTTFATLDEVPKLYEGYIIRPKWVPEGYQFVSGSQFTSIDSEIITLDFSLNDSQFLLFIHILTTEDVIPSHEFERTLDMPIEKHIGQFNVTFYNNADDIIQSAFWIYENAHYMLSGEITQEDIIRFVEHME